MDEQYVVHEYRTEKAIIRAYRPILTEEARAKRMAAIERAAVNLVMANRRLEAQRQQEAQKG